jgi:glutamate-1-semialdehyde 2,1-aminomutase
MLVRAGSGLAEMASPDSAGVSESVAAETVVVPLNDLDAVQEAFSRHGEDLAAVILEPVPANNGLLLQADDFLESVAQIARRYGALVIFDEVITGFRVAFGGMAERTGLKPDLVTYGKVIGGGFPVGAYGGRKELMDLVAPAGPVYQAGTLSANPIAMAAGLATLKKLIRDNPYAQLEARTEKLARAIERAAGVKVQNFASLFWPVFGKIQTRDGVVRTPTEIPGEQKTSFAETFHKLLGQGYYLAPSGYEVAFLSTAHTDAHNDGLVEALSR